MEKMARKNKEDGNTLGKRGWKSDYTDTQNDDDAGKRLRGKCGATDRQTAPKPDRKSVV